MICWSLLLGLMNTINLTTLIFKRGGGGGGGGALKYNSCFKTLQSNCTTSRGYLQVRS